MPAAVKSQNPEPDYYDWLRRQALILRSERPSFLDWENLAEELEAMGARERRELISHLRILIAHLLKWTYQSSRRGETSWKRSMLLARQEIAALLTDSPSLKVVLADCMVKGYADARRLAGTEMKLERGAWQRLFPDACPWSVGELLEPDYLPQQVASGRGR
ncbi:MAG TPA: DUF29 domain-containing protein [Candidatus Binataceae bacterium]|nr:DUF29 domain-containing protein [Candidatus Binataceae bacterium]